MKKFKYFVTIILIWIASSCDVLEQEPVSIISEANFFVTTRDAQAAVLGIYDRFQDHYTNFNGFYTVTIQSDETQAISGGNFLSYNELRYTASTNPANTIWIELYSTIARANDVIDNVPNIDQPDMTDELRNRFMGEAYFFRGMVHFELARRYGGVPIMKESFRGISQPFQPGRDQVKDVYTFAIDDLKKAKDLLPTGVTNKGFASKWAAAGILAKAYLTRKNPGDNELALIELNSIIDSNEYNLVTGANYASLFAPGQQNTSETIFEVSFRSEIVSNGNNLDIRMASQNRTVIPTNRMIDFFKQDSLAAVNNGGIPVRYLGSLEYVSSRRGGTNYRGTKFSKGPHDALEGRDVKQYPNAVILRLADILLLKAEVLNELGETPDAIETLNLVRGRANVPATTATTQEEVRLAVENERLIELAFEGHRFYDLVRRGRMLQVLREEGRLSQTILDNLTEDKLIWPISQQQLDQNPNMAQNPTY